MEILIKIKTWGCICGYHIDLEPIGLLCPSCNQNNLEPEIDPKKLSTVTIMDINDINNEILRIEKEKKGDKFSNKEIDLSTKVKKDNYINDRKNDIENSIERMKEIEHI